MNAPDTTTFYVVDDDDIQTMLVTDFLSRAGYVVYSSTDSTKAVAEIAEKKPDCVLVDLMMPKIDGFEVIEKLRSLPDLRNTKIAVVSSKTYDSDRRRAAALGVNAYILKPLDHDTFLAQIEALIHDRIALRYWGVRGTLPLPGAGSMRYGGDTSCMTLSAQPDHFFIFDGGTGLRRLSNHLMAKKRRITGRMLISHPHLDHLLGIPFFAPFYVPGNEFSIFGCGGADGMRGLVNGVMQDPYFPITTREFGANVFFRDLHEESFELDGAVISTMLLNHPGKCLGYRLDILGHRVCYVTDHELFGPGDPEFDEHYRRRLVEFIAGSDILITEATYRNSEYSRHRGWGHSTASAVAELAHDAGVKELHIFHHDPSQSDDDIDAKLSEAAEALAQLSSTTRVLAPAEDSAFILERSAHTA